MTDLTLPIFTDAEKAREHLEALHWPDGPVCPHCGTVDEATLIQGKSHRAGMYQCNSCREPFTVTVGTVMEKSHIPLNKWVLGFHLMAASKKGISAHQLMRMLGIGSYRSAWFMAHRIREAMAPTKGSGSRLGGKGKIVEADETYIRKAPRDRSVTRVDGTPFTGGGRGTGNTHTVVSFVERDGPARSFHVDRADRPTIEALVTTHIHPESRLHTDESHLYRAAGTMVAKHERVLHRKREYARDDVTTNSAEGHFSVFKRGLIGTYQHMSPQHLHRYLAEFDFRRNTRERLGVNDTERAEIAMKAARDKRLTYYSVNP
jgi:transposase-like protein